MGRLADGTVLLLDPSTSATTARSAAYLPAPALWLVAALAAGSAAQGAYYGWGQLLLALLLGVAAVAAVGARSWSAAEARVAPVPACAALSAWAVLSAALAGEPARAASIVALLAAVVAVLGVCRRTAPAHREALAGAAVAVGALVAASGWVGVAWRVRPWALEDQGLWRAATTLTYANAAAGLLVPLALLAVARLAARPRSALAAPAATTLLLVGTGATLSRGGALALAVGLVVLVALLGPGATLRAAGPPAVGAAVALAGLAPSVPSTSPPRPVLAAALLALGLAVSAALSRPGRRTPAVALTAAALVGCVALVVGPQLVDAAGQITRPRLTVAAPARGEAARAALRLAATRPVTGVGPGQATLVWTDGRGQPLVAAYAHNEYLQVLAELGAVGLALLLVLLAAVARTVGRGRDLAPSPQVWAGVVAGLAALAVHSALDFLWHLPVIPLAGALLAGLTVPTLMEETP